MTALRQPRAEGAVAIGVGAEDGITRLGTLRQAGSARLLIPDRRDAALEGVFLNTAGGITGGDRLALSARAGQGARLVLTTQAAERAYRAQPGEVGRVSVRLDLAAGARIDWLPQETILFEGSALRRRIEVEAAPGATLLLAEAVVLGREAMGETLHAAAFRDDWRISVGGALVHAEALRMEGDIAALAARAAVLAGARAFATILLAGPEAEGLLPALRAVLGPHGAAGLKAGLLLARLVAPDGLALRGVLAHSLAVLSARPLPRVWRL